MPPKLFIDLDSVDLDQEIRTREEVESTVPQRHEMAQIHAIHHYDPESGIAVASREIGTEEWWVRGHIPGRPIFPGVLLVEAAAQLCTWLYKELLADDRFMGFGGIDGVRFRGVVEPGCRVVLIAKLKEQKSRRTIFQCQAVAEGRLVFEGTITGMAV